MLEIYLNCKVQDCQPGVGVRLKEVKNACIHMYMCHVYLRFSYIIRRVYLDQQIISLQIMQGLQYASSLPGVR